MGMVELKVEAIALDSGNQPVIVLKDADGKRSLPIWIGPAEAVSIYLALEGQTPPRPMTHDLLCSVLSELGVQVERVVISDVRDQTYYARLVIRSGGEEKDIDCRPSDGIAIALRTGVPITISDDLFTQVEAEHRLRDRKVFVVDSGESTIH